MGIYGSATEKMASACFGKHLSLFTNISICLCAQNASNAATDATYTCSDAFDSDVSACKSGFYEDATGTAELCTGKLSPPMYVHPYRVY